MSALYADYEGDNVLWTAPFPGIEPWESDEGEPDEHLGLCTYCDETDPAMMRENPEPFGGKPCCEGCFSVLIGGSEDDPPWRCGSEDAGAASVPTTKAGQ